jgi:phage tail protein X
MGSAKGTAQWTEVIEKIMHANGGVASLGLLYQQASQYRSLPSGDWQKTLRSVLYREVRRGRYVKVGLGVYALPSAQPQTSAYVQAVQGISPNAYLQQVNDVHSAVEGMLLEIGNYLEYQTYTSDRNRAFDGKRLGDLCRLQQVPPFTYSELMEVAARCDVIWFSNASRPFPKYIYEVENTTNFVNSMHKIYQLRDIDARFVLVAPEKRRKAFEQALKNAPFESVASRYTFRSFEQVAEFYFN